jgi:hypothetical protein
LQPGTRTCFTRLSRVTRSSPGESRLDAVHENQREPGLNLQIWGAQAYEIWNEENLAREMGAGNVAPSRYLPLLQAGYGGVKAGDPAAPVLLGAPGPTGANIPAEVIDDLSYLQRIQYT